MNQRSDLSREHLIHSLYEAAEVEHNLMCTYLYAAFSLKDGTAEGLSVEEAESVDEFRRAILNVAVDEMSHLVAVWNITAALGGSPRFGRGNFPLDPGYLPAQIVVRLAPFDMGVLQHFIHLERPNDSIEPDGESFRSTYAFSRSSTATRLTPMGIDYSTIGQFYMHIEDSLQLVCEQLGEDVVFCADPALQMGEEEVLLPGAQRVRCLKTALLACDTIIRQGEGARESDSDSHYCQFLSVREKYQQLLAANPNFAPAHPAATNPVLRRPPRPEGRVWIQEETSAQIVDLANASYQTMLRLLAYSYSLPSPSDEKSLVVQLGVDLMKGLTLLGQSAARRPAGPDHPGCHAGVSFTALRDSAPLRPSKSTRQFFAERFSELSTTAQILASAGHDPRLSRAASLFAQLQKRASTEMETRASGDEKNKSVVPPSSSSSPQAAGTSPSSTLAPPTEPPRTVESGVETVEGQGLTLSFYNKRCIHSRYCVTGAPRVFLANVQGAWLFPDEMRVEELAAIARACPSGAITYRRKDGGPDESAPPVNLIRVGENGPYAVRGALKVAGQTGEFRATLCRCGACKNKPYCDGSHHEVRFTASGEPATGDATEMLAQRDGPLEVEPQLDGPLVVRGNMEIISGTGRMVARLRTTKLCRCGHSSNKPYCDGTHVKVGFRSS